MKNIDKWIKMLFVATGVTFLAGCEGTTTSVSVGYGVYGGYGYPYYGGGYYGGGYRPPHHRPPNRPGKPEHPVERPRPDRPSTKPTRPSSRPSTRPMGRPSGGMSMRRR